MNVGDDRRDGPASSRCRARPRAWRSPAASSTRCSRSPRAASTEIIAAAGARWWPCRRRMQPIGDGCTARLRLRQPATRSPRSRHPRRRGRAAAAAGRRSPTSSRTPTRWRATPVSRRSRSSRRPGCRRSPTTPGSRSTPSTARPGVHSARYAGSATARTPTTAASCSTALAGDRRPARPASARSRWPCGPTGASSSSRACARARSATATRGAAASATTRCSCPTTATAARSPRCPHAEKNARRPTAAAPSAALAATDAARRHQPRRSIGQRSMTSSPSTTWSRLVHRHRRVDVGRDAPARGRRREHGLPSGANVTCSSEQNHTFAAVDRRVAVVHAERLEPDVGDGPAVGQTEITVPSTYSACANGSPSVP